MDSSHQRILAALGRAVTRATDVTIERSPELADPLELRPRTTGLPRWAAELLADRGWRSAYAVPLDDTGLALVASDFGSARRWAAADRALCELAAQTLPHPGFAERMRLALDHQRPAGLLLVGTEPHAAHVLDELRALAGPGDIVGTLASGEHAVLIAGQPDLTVARIEAGLARAGIARWWLGYAHANADEPAQGDLLARAYACLSAARSARLPTYHGVLPRRHKRRLT